MERQIILELLILVIVFALLLTMPQNLWSNVRENTTSRDIVGEAMAFTRDPTATIDHEEMPDNMHSYTIDVNLEIMYSGKLEQDAVIIPIVEYKDKSARAKVTAGPSYNNEQYNDILLSSNSKDPDYKKFSGIVRAEIQTEIPPIGPISGEMKQGWKRTLQDKYVVGVVDISRTLDLMNLIPSDIREPSCKAQFLVEDEKTPKYATLRKGERKEILFENEKVVLSVTKFDDSCRKVVFNAVPTGGETWGKGEKQGITEKLRISFWKFSDCTRFHNSYEKLSQQCMIPEENDFLGRKTTEVLIKDIK